MRSVPAVGQVKAAKQTKRIWRKDLVLSGQRGLGDSSKLPPMVVDDGARFYDGTPGIDAPDVCKCVAVGTADARRPARLVVPDVERVLVGDLFGSQIQGDLIGASQWRIYQGVAKEFGSATSDSFP